MAEVKKWPFFKENGWGLRRKKKHVFTFRKSFQRLRNQFSLDKVQNEAQLSQKFPNLEEILHKSSQIHIDSSFVLFQSSQIYSKLNNLARMPF